MYWTSVQRRLVLWARASVSGPCAQDSWQGHWLQESSLCASTFVWVMPKGTSSPNLQKEYKSSRDRPDNLKIRIYFLVKKTKWYLPYWEKNQSLRARRSMQGTTEGDWVFPSGFSKTNIPFIVRRMLLATCVCFYIYRAQPQNSFSYAHCSDSPSENQRSK